MTTLVLLMWIIMIPSTALAQAAIAGMVKDDAGGPISGVVVEAASSALIEKTRTAITDDGGHYRIENLPPGRYSVTFLIAAASVYRYDFVDLTGSFTAVVDAALSPLALHDTIVVAHEVPAVDVRGTQHEITVTGEVARTLPIFRTYNALLALVPGVVVNANDTVTATATAQFPIHGGRTTEGRLSLDHLTIGSPPNGNSATSYVVDVGQAREITFSTNGLGEVETGGLEMNIVPNTGGNVRHASFSGSGSGRALQSSNVTPELRALGLMMPMPLMHVYDISGAHGGPVFKDRLWYFVSAHTGGSSKEVPNVFYNLNEGNPSAWLYSPDYHRREYSDRVFENASGRLTWQALRRHRVGAFWDAQSLCRTCTGATPGLSEPARVSPEAVGVLGRPLHVSQATWSSPASRRLLLEAGFSSTSFGVGNFERSPNPTRDLIRVAEQCTRGCQSNGNIPGLVYRSQDFSRAYTSSYLWKAGASIVRGANSVRVGYQHTLMTDDRTWMTNSQNLTYRFDDGVPNQLTQSISPWVNNARAAWQAAFVQGQWTRERLTLQGALRFDRAWSWFPAQREGPSRFLPTPIDIPFTRGVDSYKDLSPRMGAALDVRGDGRTATKVTLGRYLEGAGTTGNYANANPTLRMPQTTPVMGPAGVTRAWTDANGNVIPNCDLRNPNAQDLRATGGDFCGVVSNTSFGQPVLTNNFDPRALSGWRVRPSDWNLGVTVQQQIGTQSSLDVTYARRWFHGFFVADNRALQPSDLDPFSIVAPLDVRLPGGGGYVVSGLYDVAPGKAGQVENLIATADSYGRWWQYFNGIDVTVNVRTRHGLMLAGGTSTGQTVADNCDVRARLPELSTTAIGASAFGAGLAASAVTPASPYCHVAFGVQTHVRGFGSYAVPWGGVQLSAAFQSKPGAMLAANYAAPNAAAAPSLGRNLSGNAPNVTVNLLPPGVRYGDRINQLDVRVAKILKYGRARATVAVDVYNALNSSTVLAYNMSFVPGGTWLQPLTILTPRFIKLTAELDI